MKTTLALFAALLVLAGCSKRENALKGELQLEKSSWLARGLHNYSYDYERTCFCGNAGVYHVTVKNDVVTAVTGPNAQPVALSANDAWYSIPELYDYLIDAVPRADQVQVHFDKEAHLPTLVFIDFISNAIDDELSLSIDNFVIAPSQLVTGASRLAVLPTR